MIRPFLRREAACSHLVRALRCRKVCMPPVEPDAVLFSRRSSPRSKAVLPVALRCSCRACAHRPSTGVGATPAVELTTLAWLERASLPPVFCAGPRMHVHDGASAPHTVVEQVDDGLGDDADAIAAVSSMVAGWRSWGALAGASPRAPESLPLVFLFLWL